jgi:hypothetical protein
MPAAAIGCLFKAGMYPVEVVGRRPAVCYSFMSAAFCWSDSIEFCIYEFIRVLQVSHLRRPVRPASN